MCCDGFELFLMYISSKGRVVHSFINKNMLILQHVICGVVFSQLFCNNYILNFKHFVAWQRTAHSHF